MAKVSVIRLTLIHDLDGYTYLRRFLGDLKLVASNSNPVQKSFFAKSTPPIPTRLISVANANFRSSVFLGEVTEKDRRKQVVHFVDSWDHVCLSKNLKNHSLIVQLVLLPTSTHERRPRPWPQDLRAQRQLSLPSRWSPQTA